MPDAVKQSQGPDRQGRRRRRWIADNDDSLPNGIYTIVDALARAAAARDHYAASRETAERD